MENKTEFKVGQRVIAILYGWKQIWEVGLISQKRGGLMLATI